MPDATYDAVIIGGGTKGLFLAMYLLKYAGMSVGVFERRHELGGCLATEEISAPGFRDNTHANIIIPFYYSPLWRDFPEFWDYGAQIDQYLCSDGAVFANNETCLAIYSEKHDPTQERTAREIARFSERDAERWLKLWEISQDEFLQGATAASMSQPFEYQADAAAAAAQTQAPPDEAMMVRFQKLSEAGLIPDQLIRVASPLRACRETWESEEVQYCLLRFAVSSATDINESGGAGTTGAMGGVLPSLGFARGGTHQIAHAAHQILVQLGCKFFTHCEVEKLIIENGTAKGIRLADGTEIGARKLVVSAGLHPRQVCFDLIGRELIDDKLARRIDLLEAKFGCLMWYSLALHEAPKYKAAAFNPDINETYWLGLANDASPEHIARQCHYAKLGVFPPLEDYNPVVWCNSLVDPSYAPPGKHLVNTEEVGPGATYHTEREWLEIKKRYTEELLTVWQKYAPNMTWDNVIGVNTNTPYDCYRMKNLIPDGCWATLDTPPWQSGANRPTPELANYRTPVKNFYATGGAWNPLSAMAGGAYMCYKIMAKDLGLGKPWEEPGKEEPDSLVQQLQITKQRIRELGKSE